MFFIRGINVYYMAVPPQESGQVDFSRTAIAVGMQTRPFILDCLQQSLNGNFVVATISASPAGLNSMIM